MRHGLIHWDDAELSADAVRARQARLQAALRSAGLDGLLIYTNHVRSASVTWATGFTPYWSDALWLLPTDAAPLFATALSRRVGNWIAATNPTSVIAHSPKPGGLIGLHMRDLGASRLGVVELDRMPKGLIDEISAACPLDLSDATALFCKVRTLPDSVEAGLVARAARVADHALASIPTHRSCAGDVMQAVELSARLAGAEEVYVAVAPDMDADQRFARVKGNTPLGARFAIRVTVARHGAWVRRITTLAKDSAASDHRLSNWFDSLRARTCAAPGFADQLSRNPVPDGMTLKSWWIEAPTASRPLQIVAESGRDPAQAFAAANLTLHLSSEAGEIVLAGPFMAEAG